jgi:TonB family protein
MTSERALEWVEGIAHRLIHHAARRAPDSLADRLEEEWLADLASQRGPIRRLRFAFGCCWAINVIAHEHAVAALPVASSPTGQGHFIHRPGGNGDAPFFTARTITFLLVATLHAALLYGLATGLGPKFTKIIASPLVPRILEPPPRDSLPPPPQPKVSATRIELPPGIDMPPMETDSKNVIEGTSPELPPRTALPPTSPPVVNRVPGGPGSGFPSTDDFYPDASIRLGEKGLVTVRACVDPQGRLTSEPTIVQSTASARLQESALRLAKAGSGHYRATTEDGRPVDSCYAFRIRFDLRN